MRGISAKEDVSTALNSILFISMYSFRSLIPPEIGTTLLHCESSQACTLCITLRSSLHCAAQSYGVRLAVPVDIGRLFPNHYAAPCPSFMPHFTALESSKLGDHLVRSELVAFLLYSAATPPPPFTGSSVTWKLPPHEYTYMRAFLCHIWIGTRILAPSPQLAAQARETPG